MDIKYIYLIASSCILCGCFSVGERYKFPMEKQIAQEKIFEIENNRRLNFKSLTTDYEVSDSGNGGGVLVLKAIYNDESSNEVIRHVVFAGDKVIVEKW